jgi:hypothetical protein
MRGVSMPQAKGNQHKIVLAWWIGILSCAIIFTVGCKTVYITEAEVHRRIRAEIPSGSTYSQVNDFLKKNDWGADRKLFEFEDFGTHDDMLTEEEKQKIRWTSSSGIRTIEKNLLWAWGIVMKFYYDQDEKLVTYNLVKYRY